MGSLHHDRAFRRLPPDLQARLEVTLPLSAQMAAIRALTNDIQKVLELAAPEYTAYGSALDHHVRLLETYFAEAETEAFGMGWRRG